MVRRCDLTKILKIREIENDDFLFHEITSSWHLTENPEKLVKLKLKLTILIARKILLLSFEKKSAKTLEIENDNFEITKKYDVVNRQKPDKLVKFMKLKITTLISRKKKFVTWVTDDDDDAVLEVVTKGGDAGIFGIICDSVWANSCKPWLTTTLKAPANVPINAPIAGPEEIPASIKIGPANSAKSPKNCKTSVIDWKTKKFMMKSS